MTDKDRTREEPPKGRTPEEATSIPSLFTYKRADVRALIKQLRREATQSSQGKSSLLRKMNNDSPKPERTDRTAARESTARNLTCVL